MSDDNYIAGERTTRLFGALAAVAFVLFVGTVGGCVAYESALIERLIAAGTEPLRASCAIRPSQTQCHTVAALTGRDAK